MSSGTQIDMDLMGMDGAAGGSAAAPASAPDAAAAASAPNAVTGANAAAPAAAKYLTDEEILGIDSAGADAQRDSSGNDRSQNDAASRRNTESAEGNAHAKTNVAGEMPAWMKTAAGDSQHGPEAQKLWQEHQAFRASFSSPDEARAIKELFPGGAPEAQALRQASQAVEQLDAAIYSGDARAQSEVVSELARANPAAFRQLFSEAAKVLAGLGQAPAADQTGAARKLAESLTDKVPAVRDQDQREASAPGNQRERAPGQTDRSPQAFDSAAYAAFERSTNDSIGREVRGAVGETLARVLPEGIAEGAARRIGEDIFNEIHRTLAADRTLSEQIGEILRGSPRESTANGWRFGMQEQQRVASVLGSRAKQLVPGVARRVISEWTSSVLGASRSKAARQASASSRVDIAAPGGSLDSAPLRPMSNREIDYASMSDDQILGM